MNADYESMPPQPMALCYHCDQKEVVPGSVFCGTCQPDRTGQPPRIIHEKRPAMRRKGLFSAFFGLLASSKRVGKVEASLRDCEQANLALRRKCADLKDQLRASEAAFESLYKENALAKAAHNRAATERDVLREALLKAKRVAACCHCGEEIWRYSSSEHVEESELKASLSAMRAHDAFCQRNPVVQRIKKLQDILADIAGMNPPSDRTNEEHAVLLAQCIHAAKEVQKP